MNLQLKEKTALLTGASQGLGRAITMALAAEGVKVFAVARNLALLTVLQEEIKAQGGEVPVIYSQDLMDPESPQKIAEKALETLGHIDILINNAGRSQPVNLTGNDELWKSSMTLDFERPRQLTEALLPQFIERRNGSILNLTSTYELRTLNVSAVAKGAITVWSKQLAGELSPYGIRVNCLQPGLFDTENVRRFMDAAQRNSYAATEIPLGALGEPDQIAGMAVFLASPMASYITGTVVTVDGGANRPAF